MTTGGRGTRLRELATDHAHLELTRARSATDLAMALGVHSGRRRVVDPASLELVRGSG